MGELKPRTLYRCPCGKRTLWTGADPEPTELLVPTCSACGGGLLEVVDDGRRWRVSFEYVPPLRAVNGTSVHELDESAWSPVSRETADEQDARNQVAGLLELIRSGELIRNVRLEVAEVVWRPVDVVGGGGAG